MLKSVMIKSVMIKSVMIKIWVLFILLTICNNNVFGNDSINENLKITSTLINNFKES